MKRYLTIVLGVFLSMAGLFYLYFISGFYIPSNTNEIPAVSFKVENEAYYAINDERSEEIAIKGIHVGQTTAFQNAMDFETDEETFFRWFSQISDMGANTIKINTIYNQAFYDALYRYNQKENTKPLFLLQGIRADEDSSFWDKDAYASSFIDQLKKNGRKAVDVIHGRKVSLNDTRTGNGIFVHDLSPWVIGYIIGDEWNPDLIAYTNGIEDNPVDFNGAYVTTINANAFEVVMAKIMDDLIGYETMKYGSQRPISFISSLSYDPFQYKEEYIGKIGKYNTLDIEHLQSTKLFKAGIFAAYQYEEPSEDIFEQLEVNSLNNALLQQEGVNSYLSLLSAYHDKAVVITHFNVPSARTFIAGGYGISEEMQGERIVAYLEEFKAAGIPNAVIHSWQDTWYLRAWNTAYAIDKEMTSRWQDTQTQTQHYGMMKFEPLRNGKVMRVDGSREDWEDIQAIENNGYEVSVASDHSYLYLYINGIEAPFEKTYVGFDFLNEIGTKYPSDFPVEFNREIDFLLKVQGEKDTEIFVQERYESTRPQFLERLHGVNPYIVTPAKNSTKMRSIDMVGWSTDTRMPENGLNDRVRFERFNTGKLIHGNGNPDEPDFNSLADFSFGDHSVEIRIPYYLLNFSDPIKRFIHDDYYSEYGVEPLGIDHFYLGVGSAEDEVELVKVDLPPLRESGESNERLKESYGIIQAYWRK